MLSVKPDLYSFVINRAGLSRPPATPKLNKAAEAAKAFLAGQYSGCTAAANAFGVDNPTHVRYYVNKWADTDVEAALVQVECDRADAFLRGDPPIIDPHTPTVTGAAAASLASMSQDVTSTSGAYSMSKNVPPMMGASGLSPLLPLDLSAQF
ncbi:hypothetical protein CYMTET_53656 [Cymbomonas tetramitiformis]|uniref:Uncharacterized protein n=1 Tax=Cymbomonas tetramitiformis TaxID=36881 RepID=A0AAE0BGE7_9CHLO|nr:hypothetical protein CYMTET_53656 [Cymbomonas tetramitiformis]